MPRIGRIAVVCLALAALSAGRCPAADTEELARRLLDTQGCKACHRFEGGTTKTGPDLVTIGRSLNRTELMRSLANPERRHGDGRIPDFSHLAEKELKALVTFIHGLRPEGERTPPALRAAPQAGPNRTTQD